MQTVVCHNPTWLPKTLRRKLRQEKEIRYSLTFTRAEKKIFRKKKHIPVSEWAERHRVLTMSSIPGPWKNNITPYLAGVMDAAMFPSVQTVILVAAPQTGKSESVHNVVGYCIDRYPGPVLYVYPDELTARENSRDRILPMIESSPKLSSYMTGVQDDAGMLRINLQHMPIYTAWARSASRLANKPIRVVIFDEVDKYPATAGPKETDPISLGEKRTITYSRGRKIIKMSTPTTESNFIWQAYTKEAEIRFQYWVKCPECLASQIMIFDRIRTHEDLRDSNLIRKNLAAWYVCRACGCHWDDHDRNAAVRLGEWRENIEEESMTLNEVLYRRNPRKIAFHLPSWTSPFVSLSDVLADWFACIYPAKDKTKLKDFLNAHKAEPWLDYATEREENRILELRDDRPRGLVPGGGIVAGLTAAVDTHDDGFYYEIRAWGVGLSQESWQVREGFVTHLESLEQILWEDDYKDSAGIAYTVQRTLIDSAGHRTAEVYDWCRRHPGRILPLKGERRMSRPLAMSKIDVYPGTSKPIPGGLRLLRVDTSFYKDLLASKLEVNPMDPGAWHLHSEADWSWAAQLCAEFVNEKGEWECPQHKRNEAWDLGVYNLAAADVEPAMKYWKGVDQASVKGPKAHKSHSEPERIRLW